MRFSLNWIRDYVTVTESPEALARRLTLGGLAVDQVEETVPLPDTVVVGRILEAKPHPNADRLRVCTVDVGGDEPLNIVCGAPNARDGLYSPVAMVGTSLPNGITIKKAKLRGEVSMGMLCSEIELGRGDDASGIMELAPMDPGTPLASVWTDTDTVLDIDVPSNRGDCLSHLGVAREIGALTGETLRTPEYEPVEKGTPADKQFRVTVEDPEDCPRFTAHVIRNVTIGPSPEWLVKRLESVGQRSINNVVDVTNFVMLETGQPLHSFDMDWLGDRIHVRRAKAGERIKTLDDVDRNLTPEVLLITDGTKPVAVAGVMGGANSEVNPETRNILLEAACFRPQRVLWGSRQLRMDTDASLRFRRGVDPGNTAWAAKRAAVLIAELGGGELAPGMVEVADAKALAPRTVTLRPAKVGEILGDPVGEDEVEKRLRSFGFELDTTVKPWAVAVPSWRRDVFEECDLAEEIGRHRGYDTIGVRNYNFSAVSAPVQPQEETLQKIGEVLRGFGFQESLSRNLCDSRTMAAAGLDAKAVEETFFSILDPPSREEEGLRPSLLPALLEIVGHNLRHDWPRVRLYEIGKTFHRTPRSGNGADLPQEIGWVGLAASGGTFPPSLEQAGGSYNFLEFKGVIEAFLSCFRIDSPKWRSYTGLGLVPDGSLEIRAGDDEVGFAWEVTSEIRDRWDLSRPVYLAQIRLDALSADPGTPEIYREPSRFPAVRRDLALVVPDEHPQASVREWIRENAGGTLAGLELFDFYRGKHIPGGHVGLGYRLTFRAPDRTLEEKEVDAAVEKIVGALERRKIARREA